MQFDIDGLPADAPELRLSALLDQYRSLREERLSGETKRKQAAAGLLISGLQQRLLSSIEAFARTLRVHRRTVQRQWEAAQAGKPPVADRSRPSLSFLPAAVGSDDDRAALTEEDLQAEEEAQMAAATAATAGPWTDARPAALFAREQKLLDEMTEIAEAARGLPDARVRRLIALDSREHVPRPVEARMPAWNDIRVIIFTEYDDTKRYLHAAAFRGHRGHRPGRRADRHLPRPHAARRAGGDQAGLQQPTRRSTRSAS